MKKKLYSNSRHFTKRFYFKVTNSFDREQKKIKLIRPLLKFSRFEFLKLCEFWNLPIYPDFTNFNFKLRRNRLRLQFFPYLKFFFSFDFSKKINQVQKIIRLENHYFQYIIEKLFFALLKNFQSNKNFYCVLRKIYLFYFPKIIKYRIFHYFYFLLKKNISFDEIHLFFEKLNIKKK